LQFQFGKQPNILALLFERAPDCVRQY